MSSFYAPYTVRNRGVGLSQAINEPPGQDVFTQIWSSIGNSSAAGASSTGEIASWLLGAGYSVATISALLNNVSQVADVTPQMIAAAQQEQLWLQQYNRRTNWIPILIAGGVLLWAVSRGKN